MEVRCTWEGGDAESFAQEAVGDGVDVLIAGGGAYALPGPFSSPWERDASAYADVAIGAGVRLWPLWRAPREPWGGGGTPRWVPRYLAPWTPVSRR